MINKKELIKAFRESSKVDSPPASDGWLFIGKLKLIIDYNSSVRNDIVNFTSRADDGITGPGTTVWSNSARYEPLMQVQLRGVPDDLATKQEFQKFVDSRLREHDSRFEELSFTSTLTGLNGKWAVTYALRYLDKNPVNSSTPLFMTIKGFMYMLLTGKTVSSMPSAVNEEPQLSWTVL